MKKIKFKLFRRLFFYFPIILILCLFCLSLFNISDNKRENQKETQSLTREYSITSFLISNQTDKKEIFNCKTPRALFADLVNQNLIIWCGYYGSITQAIDCIAPVKYDINDDTELA